MIIKQEHKDMAYKLVEDLCQKNIDWKLATESNILLINNILDSYHGNPNLIDKYQFWYGVKKVLQNQLTK